MEKFLQDKSLHSYFSRAKGLIFDLDGTLVNLEKLNSYAYIKTIKYYSQDSKCDYTDYFTLFAGRGAVQGFIDSAEHFGIDNNVSEIVEYFRAIKRKALKTETANHVTLIPGASAFLQNASIKYPIIVATSTTFEFAKIILDHFSLMHIFKKVISIEDVTHSKPNPESFLVASKALNVSPQETIIFEDSANGLKAAQSVTDMIIVIHTPKHNDQVLTKEIVSIQNYNELLPYIG